MHSLIVLVKSGVAHGLILVNLFNPKMVIIGRGVGEALEDLLIKRLCECLSGYALPQVYECLEVVKTKLGYWVL